MLKKTCKYLDANLNGIFFVFTGLAMACCDRSIAICNMNNFDDSDFDRYIETRKKFIEDINSGVRHDCDGCPALIEKEEDDIDVEHFSYINLGSFATCNLRCKYCYFTKEQLGSKLQEKDKYIMPILLKLHEKKLLRENITLAIAGGEPTLYEDIPVALNFLKKHYKHVYLNLQSNSSISSRVKLIADEIKDINIDWKKLYTSIDAGTKETFEKIRGRNLYSSVVENLLYYAENNVFDEIQLKYILLNDKENNMYNISMADIWGFCELLKQVVKVSHKKTTVIIDRDLHKSQIPMDEDLLKAGTIITYVARKLGIACVFSPCNFIAKEDVLKIQNMSLEYESLNQTTEEQKFFNSWKNELPTFDNNIEYSLKKICKQNSGKNVLLYGAGSFAKQILSKNVLDNINVVGIVDKSFSDYEKDDFMGYTKKSINQMKKTDFDVLLLTVLSPNIVLRDFGNNGVAKILNDKCVKLEQLVV